MKCTLPSQAALVNCALSNCAGPVNCAPSNPAGPMDCAPSNRRSQGEAAVLIVEGNQQTGQAPSPYLGAAQIQVASRPEGGQPAGQL